MTEFMRFSVANRWRYDYSERFGVEPWSDADEQPGSNPREVAIARFSGWFAAHAYMCVRVTDGQGQQMHYIMTENRELQRAEEGVHYDRANP